MLPSNLGPSLKLSAFVARKASLALFVLASQEPLLTPRNQVLKRRAFIGAAFFIVWRFVLPSNLGPSLKLSAFVARKASLALFVLASQEPLLTPRNQVLKRRAFIGAAFLVSALAVKPSLNSGYIY